MFEPMREKLEAAWNDAHNHEKAPWETLAYAEGVTRFTHLLDAEAWLDAAMMLLDGETFWCVGHDGEGPDPSQFKATIGKAVEDWIDWYHAVAPTPAAALLSAIEKARV